MICTYNLIKLDLENSLNPDFIEIIDQSGLHADHYDKGDEQIISHLKIIIYSKLFDNKSVVECHRLVKNALKEKFNEGLHALTIEIKK